MRLQKLLFLILALYSTQTCAENSLTILDELQSASLLLIDHNNAIKQSKNPDQLFIPASTVKLLTALIALEHWGAKHRFTTRFYFDVADKFLWVKGMGDPYLISEELDLIVERLHGLGIRQVQGIGVDAHYFDESIRFDGSGDTDNPYDASVSALAANFNTVKIRVVNGRVTSGEVQTPITSVARTIGSKLAEGTHRVNLGQSQLSPHYFAELLSAKLREVDIGVRNVVVHDVVPPQANLLFEHLNSRNLEQVVTAMLEFSNNFIANQLYLLLGAEKYGTPVTIRKSQRLISEYIDTNFQWENYVLLDGAGLSRNNRLSARHLIDVLRAFARYRYMLPAQNNRVRAKTGTLKNVSTYAGYLHNGQNWSTFALMINQPVGYYFREQLAEDLLK